MKKGCVYGSIFGCGGFIILFLLLIILVNLLSDTSFDLFEDTKSDYSFEVDTLNNQPVITSNFQWRFTSGSLGRKSYSLTFQLLEAEVKEALNYLDRLANTSITDLGVDSRYERSDPVYYSKLLWHAIYKRVYWQAYDKFDHILGGFDEVFRIEKMSNRDKVYFVISFIQNIEYKRPGGTLDLLPPLGSLAMRYGDCDTKALMLYIILEKMGVDCIMYWSYQYKHAMLGLAVTGRGNFKSYAGKNYYFVETTYPNWGIGDIAPDMNDLNYWFIDDLDSDGKFKSDEKPFIIPDKIDEQIDEQNRENSGKRDKPSPSNN